MEFEILNIEIDLSNLLILVNLMANESESAVGYFDLLLELKAMGLSLNSEEPRKISVPFTIKNVLDVLDFLSKKQANIYADLFGAFVLDIETALENKEDRIEAEYLIFNKLNELRDDKARQLNQDYQNGINILRLTNEDFTPS